MPTARLRLTSLSPCSGERAAAENVQAELCGGDEAAAAATVMLAQCSGCDLRATLAAAAASSAVDAFGAALAAAEGLRRELGARRQYVLRSGAANAEADAVDAALPRLDPRLLLFEYASGFLLREQQVEILRRFERCSAQQASSVRQMLMGEGKSSVVAPILAVMLAERGGVILAAPDALTTMSENFLSAGLRPFRRRAVQVREERAPITALCARGHACALARTAACHARSASLTD